MALEMMRSWLSLNIGRFDSRSMRALAALGVLALLLCRSSISVLASVKLFFIALKLSRNPCELLSCPAFGYVPSTFPGTILLAIY